MKKPNAKCEFSSQRSHCLLQNFRESIARQSVISIKKAFQDASSAPAPRFWVSEARATRIISLMLKDKEDVLSAMLPEKRRMYVEIFRRVKKMMKENPEMPLGDIVFEVVNSKAPESYISWHYASILVNSLRNLNHKKK